MRLEEAAAGAPQHPNPLRGRHCDRRRRRACAALPCPPWLRPLQELGPLWSQAPPLESVRPALGPTGASPLVCTWATGKHSVSRRSAGSPGDLRTRAVSLLPSRALFGVCVSQVTGCLSQPEAVPASIQTSFPPGLPGKIEVARAGSPAAAGGPAFAGTVSSASSSRGEGAGGRLPARAHSLGPTVGICRTSGQRWLVNV